jgi:hypothetical protein
MLASYLADEGLLAQFGKRGQVHLFGITGMRKSPFLLSLVSQFALAKAHTDPLDNFQMFSVQAAA